MVLDRHETVLAQPFMWAPVAALAPQTEQVSPLPRVTPPVPEPVVVGDVNREDVSHLSHLFIFKSYVCSGQSFCLFLGKARVSFYL